MSNVNGFPIWYELLTNDATASRAFYERVIGWKYQEPSAQDPMHYYQMDTGDGFVGGMMELDEKMRANGARPTWLFYLNVDDVDATLKQVEAHGGTTTMPAFDLAHVGRIAMIADPQGNPLYVMRPSSHETSSAFDRKGMGKCNWNELTTSDPAASQEFYERIFGWTYPESMPMPTGGRYALVHAGDIRIAGTMKAAPGAPSGWQFYFRTADIDASVEAVKNAGGKVHAGPMDVPGGDRVILASDLHGVPFGITAASE
jgi:uncharacterized protein